MKCFLCKSTKSESISLHKFPKKSNLREKWEIACGCEEINVNNLFICSQHFTPMQKRVSRGTGKAVTYIDQKAIPSIGVPHPPEEIFLIESVLQNNFVNNESSAGCSKTNSLTTDISEEQIVIDCNTEDNVEVFIDNQESFPSNSSQDTSNKYEESLTEIDQEIIQAGRENDVPQHHDKILLDTLNNNTDINIIRNEHKYSAAVKRQRKEPLFPSQIEYEDFIDDPKKAKRLIKMIIETDRKYREENQKLKKQIKYYKKKIWKCSTYGK